MIDTPAGFAEAYVTCPDGAGPWPGVLFLVDAIGLRPRTEHMADLIASWGYVVLVPNLFYRDGTARDLAPKGPLQTATERTAFFKDAAPRIAALTADLATPDVVAYIQFLTSHPSVATGDVGITGYCMGGRLALLAAETWPDVVGAVGMFHTGGLVTDAPDSPHRNINRTRAEVLAIHADNDRSLPPQAVADFEQALTKAGVKHSTSVYQGAEHGYTMSDTGMYHADACTHHFNQLRALLHRNLR